MIYVWHTGNLYRSNGQQEATASKHEHSTRQLMGDIMGVESK